MKNQTGLTLPELLIVMGILAVLFTLAVPNLLHLQRRSVLNTTVDALVSDLYSQQNKAMVGDTEGRLTTDSYGVHFDADKYTLFHGSYIAGDSTNLDIKLDPSLQFSGITSVIFAKGGGDASFAGGSDTVTLTDTTNNEQKTIQINRYGAITAP